MALVDLLAFKHHMGWLKPCADILSEVKLDWGSIFKSHLQVFAVDGWGAQFFREAEESDSSKLHQCRFCKAMAKTYISPEVFMADS